MAAILSRPWCFNKWILGVRIKFLIESKLSSCHFHDCMLNELLNLNKSFLAIPCMLFVINPEPCQSLVDCVSSRSDVISNLLSIYSQLGLWLWNQPIGLPQPVIVIILLGWFLLDTLHQSYGHAQEKSRIERKLPTDLLKWCLETKISED